jgi:thioredoxin-like negative regulator of GroEL
MAGRFSEALARLQEARTVAPEKAAALYIGMAVASLGMRQVADARRYAEQAKSAARTPEEKAAVEQLLAQVGQPSPGKTETRPAPDPDPDRPTLRRAPLKKGAGGGGGGGGRLLGGFPPLQ